MSKEPEHIARVDWRLNNVTWTTTPTVLPTGTLPIDTLIAQAAMLRIRKQQFGIAIPNATAMFLSLSYRSHEKAKELLKKCIELKDSTGHLPHDLVPTFFEEIMSSIVFACTALEAFVNEQIPDDCVHYIVKNDCTRQYNKVQIERYLTLEEKLGELLPKVLAVKKIKGGSLWGKLERLVRLRDRIIHMKTEDRQFHGDRPTSIWNDLMTEPLPETYASAKSIISQFLSAPKEPPRWFRKCPF